MRQILFLTFILACNFVFAGPVTKNLGKLVKATDQPSKEMEAVLKLKGWKAKNVFRNGNVVHLDTPAGRSTLSIKGNEITAGEFESKEFITDPQGKLISDVVSNQRIQATGKIHYEMENGSGGFFNRITETETVSVGQVLMPGSHSHSALAAPNGKNTTVNLKLYLHDVLSQREGLIDAGGPKKQFATNRTEIGNVSELIAQSKVTIEVPGEVIYQEVVEFKRNVIYQAVYKDQDGQKIAQRWIVNTDKEGKNPSVNKFLKSKKVDDLGQFNLNVVETKGPTKSPKSVN